MTPFRVRPYLVFAPIRPSPRGTTVTLPLLVLGLLIADPAPTVGPDRIPMVDLDEAPAAKREETVSRWLFRPDDGIAAAAREGMAGAERVAVLSRLGGLWILEAPADSLVQVESAWSALGTLRRDRDGVPALLNSTRIVGARPVTWDQLDLRGDVSSAVAILDSGCDTAHGDLGDPDDDNEDTPPQSAGDADDWVDAAVGGYPGDTELRVVGWHDVTDDMPGSRGPYDYHRHGTALASAAFGGGDEADAGRGIAPEGRFVVVKTYNFEGSWRVWASDFLLGVEWVLNNRDLYRIRAVLAGAVWDEDLEFTAAVEALRDAGIVLIAPSGNDPDAPLGYPAAVPDAIAVGATDDAGRLAAYSTPGPPLPPLLDLVAPGGSGLDPDGLLEVADNEPNDAYRGRFGTSLAAAHVAGTVSLLSQVLTESGRPWRNDADQVRWVASILRATAVETGAAEPGATTSPPVTRWSEDRWEGAGGLRVPTAVDAVRNVVWPGESRTFTLGPPADGRAAWAARVPTLGRATLRVELDPPPGGDFDLHVHREDPEGLWRRGFSTRAGGGQREVVEIPDPEPGWWVVVVKRISGSGPAQLEIDQDLVPDARWPVSVSSTITVEPTVADLDGDGTLEVILANNVAIDPSGHTIHVLRGDGSVLAPFPRTFFSEPERPGVLTTPAVVDLGPGRRLLFGTSFGDVWGVDANGLRAFATQLEENAPTTGVAVAGSGAASTLVVGSASGITLLDPDGVELDTWPVPGGVAREPAVADLDGSPGEEVVFVEADTWIHVRDLAGNPVTGWPRPLDPLSRWSHPVVVGDFAGARRVAMVERTAAGEARLHLWEADGTVRSGFPVSFSRSPGTFLEVPTGFTASRTTRGGAVFLWVPAWHTDPAGSIRLRLHRFGIDGSQEIRWDESVAAATLDGSSFVVNRRSLAEPRLVDLGSEPGAEVVMSGVLGWVESFLGIPRRYGSAHPLVSIGEAGDPRRRLQTRPGHLASAAPLALAPAIGDLDGDGAADLVVPIGNRLHVASAQVRADRPGLWGLDRSDLRRSGCHGCEPDPVVAVPSEPDHPFRLQAAPNPFNPRTTLRLETPGPGRVEWNVYDSRGRRVRGWTTRVEGPGVVWEPFTATDDRGRSLASGVYFVEAVQDGRGTTTRISLVR